MNLKQYSCALALAAAAGMATAQQSSLRFNEIYINPPGGGSTDERYEFIELFGCGNTSLSGLAIVVINHDPPAGIEIDEAFVFDNGTEAYQTNSAGYAVVWNSDSDSSSIATQAANNNSEVFNDKLPASITQNFATDDDFLGSPRSTVVTRYEASFEEIENVTGSETAGAISNGGSNTFLLIDLANSKRADGTTAATASDIFKDTVITDTNNDGVPDGWQNFVILDSIAYSDNGGSELAYNEANEFDFTPGYNPDALTRVDDVSIGVDNNRFIGTSSPGTENFRDAYTDWLSGDIDTNANLEYNEGIGGENRPADGATAVVAPLTDLDGYALTPGSANGSINGRGQISATGCTELATPDVDGDGIITVRDFQALLRAGDIEGALKAARMMR